MLQIKPYTQATGCWKYSQVQNILHYLNAAKNSYSHVLRSKYKACNALLESELGP